MPKVLCLSVLLLCSFASSAKHDLRIVTEELPPYQIVKQGKLVGGTSYLLVQALLKKLNITDIDIELLPWARAYRTALAVPNTLIFSVVRSAKREQQLTWVLKLRHQTYHLFSFKNQHQLPINSITQAQQYTAVAVRDSFENAALQRLGWVYGKNLKLVNNYLQVWRYLLEGKADITYANELVAQVIHKKLHLTTKPFLKRYNTGDSSDLYLAANPQTDPVLIKQLQQAFDEMKQDGSFAQIFDQALAQYQLKTTSN